MISTVLHVDQGNRYEVVHAQFAECPRSGEVISLTLPGHPERNFKITEVNYWLKSTDGQVFQQVEVVLFTTLQ